MREPFSRMLRGLVPLLLACLVGLAQAGNIEPLKGALSTAEDGSTVLDAEFDIDLGPRFEDAVSRGVPLYFSFEFELTRPRWWWSNENIVNKTAQYRLSYTALTRQYRLTTGNLHRNFSTLDEALRVLSRFVDLHVADKGVLKMGGEYEAGMRLSLDRTQLPKPMQVDIIANPDWQVSTRVLRWHYTVVPYVAPPPQSENKP